MLGAALISVLLTQSPPANAPSLSQGRAYVKLLAQGQAAKVWAAASPKLKGKFPSLDAVARFSSSLRSYGAEARVIAEGLSERDGLTVYRRSIAVSNYARGVDVELTMDEAGKVADLALIAATTEAPTTYGAYRTLTRLRPPFDGAWSVLWGGRKWEDNRHAAVSDMRYALDLLIRKDGSSCRAPCAKNDDFYAWNTPVMAAGEGTVVVAEDGVNDNQPNRPVPGNLYGNFVVIDHGTGEYSLVAHLKKGSVRVKAGEPVSAGQVLAFTGNSGMSTEPHIHYHLMDNADWKKAQGLPAQFSSFLRNGQVVDRGEAKRGDLLSTLPVEARR